MRVAGYLFGRDFPEVERAFAREAPAEQMGMSYELADAHVEDMRASGVAADEGDLHGSGDLAAREGCVSEDILSLVRRENQQ